MKSYWLFVCLIGLLGFGAAWAMNQKKYGAREAWFGKMDFGGEVNADNVIGLVKKDFLTSGAVVELLTPSQYDFGRMSAGETGKKTFVIKNVGTDDLTLKVGNSSCKCTIGKLQNEHIAPGEQTEINLEWIVKSDSTDFQQRAQIITNDPSQVVIDYQINGKVLRKMEFDPKVISFGDVAAGEDFEVKTKLYSFFDRKIDPLKAEFSSKQLQELATVTVTPFEPTEESDKSFAKATQAFELHAKVKPGMRQGVVSTRLLFLFKQRDESGKVMTDESGDDLVFNTDGEVQGRVMGVLGMISGSKLKQLEGGSYVYTFGRLDAESKMTAKTLVRLKGSEKDRTKLSIGEVQPAGILKASLGDPKGTGDTRLFPLTLEIVPGDEPADFMGKNSKEYGKVWIESDNPKVPRMLVAVKFAVDAKSD